MAAEESPLPGRNTRAVELSLPFTGRWLIENSPARRVPSHGTDLFGGRYAIDFVGVDERHRTSGVSDWRTLFATEPPERFVAFGRPLLAPGGGTVVAVHDSEPDHEARRSQLTLVPYAFGQAGRVRRGVGAIAGNHVVIALSEVAAYVVLAHCKADSVRVSPGQRVTEGQHVADCGNSGNSTQPHVHLQVMDTRDPVTARGVPVEFRRYREWPRGTGQAWIRERGVPGEGAVVEPLA
ncbi:M23 family metallopeptidase [Streptomyces diacarni]|uniref:M23 family metallopeptidase n=1 Tax=Streptomyces diacarni TaxID=2800381 RepID=UPI0033C404F7